MILGIGRSGRMIKRGAQYADDFADSDSDNNEPQLRTGEVSKSRNSGRLISKFPRHIFAIIKQLSYLFNLLKTFFLECKPYPIRKPSEIPFLYM